jgi:hypothetical protein
MGRPTRNGVWGIPWLGLPLGGVLALSVAAQFVWDLSLFEPTAVERQLLGPDRASIAASLTLESVAVPREPARSAALRSGQTLGGLLIDLGLTAEVPSGRPPPARDSSTCARLGAGTVGRLPRRGGRHDRWRPRRARRAGARAPDLRLGPEWRNTATHPRARRADRIARSLDGARRALSSCPRGRRLCRTRLHPGSAPKRRVPLLFEETVVRLRTASVARPGGRLRSGSARLEAYQFGSGESAGY